MYLTCSISLGASPAYRRMILLIYSITLLMLVQSSLYLIVKGICFIYLIYSGCRLIKKPIPHPGYLQLNYHANEWQLYDTHGDKHCFEKHKVILEAGIFFLIRLSNSNKHKLLVIFFDQLPETEFRTLKIIEKLS